MAKIKHVELNPDDPIFREGWSVHSAAPRPAKVQSPLGPPPTDEEMAEQYSLQRQLEAAIERAVATSKK